MFAEISECGQYRYVLTRKIPSILRWNRPALFIMLNPSTADAVQDDPTIRRCVGFATREGCTELTVVNLFALRATDPKMLLNHPDPIGPYNDRRIEEQVKKHRTTGIIIAAWGQHPMANDRAYEILKKYSPIQCLGTTKNGYPRHPLYLKKDAELKVFR